MSAFAERRAAACDQTPFTQQHSPGTEIARQHSGSQTPFTGALCEQVDGYRSAAVAWARDAPPEDAGEGSEAAVVAAVHARILVPRPVARPALGSDGHFVPLIFWTGDGATRAAGRVDGRGASGRPNLCQFRPTSANLA